MQNKRLEVNNLVLYYPENNRNKKVLQAPFNLMVLDGEKVLIKGRNGAGKSSVLRILAGQYDGAIVESGELLYYDQGQVYRKCPVGFVFCRYVSDKQMHYVSAGLGNLFVDNIIASGFSKNQFFYQGEVPTEIAERVRRISADLAITDLLTQQFKVLSSGQRMLILIARAFVCDPVLIILDEIEPYLDDAHRELLIPFLSESKKTIIASSHTLTQLYSTFRSQEIVGAEKSSEQTKIYDKQINHPKETLVQLIDVDYYRDESLVLGNIDLSIESGCFYHIKGENGAGKSTLLDGISRKIYPFYKNDHSGIFYPFLKDQTITAKMLDSYIGYAASVLPEITEDGKSYDNTRVIDYLWGCFEQIHPYLLDKSKSIPMRVRQALDDYELVHLSDREMGSISSGERRRLEISKAFVRKNKLVLLDEPFNNLDIGFVNQLVTVIAKAIVEDGCAVILTGHESVDFPINRKEIMLKNKKVLT